MPTLATIGVYGFEADGFLTALRGADVRLLLDVRQRRGVRGSRYAWANSRRLQDAMGAAGIGYRHLPELAPSSELRQLQRVDDRSRGVGQRSRTALSDEFLDRYAREVLDRADLAELLAALPATGAGALLCVEREASACHRSLIAERLRAESGVTVLHLRP